MTIPGTSFKAGVLTRGAQKSLFWKAVAQRHRPQIKKKLKPEEQLQCTIVSYLRVVCPQCFLFAIPNGADRGVVGHLIALQMGMEVGMQDLCLLNYNGRCWEPYFLEIKTGCGALSDSQEDIHIRQTKLSIHHAVVRSIDNVRSVLDYWKIERRDAAAAI